MRRYDMPDNKKRIVVDVPTSLHAQFKFHAESKGSSMSWIIQQYIISVLTAKKGASK